MKGIVLAGGTATRLFPLTIVTNKHLLPIYDRPMIYYPIETLAGMGIREVLVIVGGKSVGDVVELLGDGRHFGLDLTYRYQRGALGIAHAIGLARDFVGDDAFCCVLGDNILRGQALAPKAAEFEAGPWGAGTLLYRVPDPERFGVAELDAAGAVIGFEEKPVVPRATSSRSASTSCARTRSTSSTSWLRRAAANSRSPTSSTTTSRRAACSARSTTATGPMPAPSSLLRAAEIAAEDDAAGRLAAPPQRPRPTDGRGPADHGRGPAGPCAPARHRRSRLHRQLLRPRRPGPARRDPDHRPRQAHLRGQREQSRLRRGRSRAGGAADLRPWRHRRCGASSSRSSPETDAVVNFAAESHVDRSILDPEAFLRTGVIGVHVLLEALPRRGGRGRRRRARPTRCPAFLQVSTDEVYGSVATGRSTEDDRLAPRSPYSAAKASGELLVRSYVVTHGIDAVVTRGSNTYGPYQHPEKLIPLFITNALDDKALPLYGDGLQRRDWLYVADHAGAIDHVLRHGVSGETYNVPGSVELTNREVVRRSSTGSASRGRSSGPWRTGPATTGATRWTAPSWPRSAGGTATAFDDGIAATVDWFVANEDWWRAARSGDWDAYYARQYGSRLAGSTPAGVRAGSCGSP